VLPTGPLSGPLRYGGDGMDERTIQIVQQTVRGSMRVFQPPAGCAADRPPFESVVRPRMQENAVGQAAQKVIPFTFDRVRPAHGTTRSIFDS